MLFFIFAPLPINNTSQSSFLLENPEINNKILLRKGHVISCRDNIKPCVCPTRTRVFIRTECSVRRYAYFKLDEKSTFLTPVHGAQKGWRCKNKLHSSNEPFFFLKVILLGAECGGQKALCPWIHQGQNSPLKLSGPSTLCHRDLVSVVYHSSYQLPMIIIVCAAKYVHVFL